MSDVTFEPGSGNLTPAPSYVTSDGGSAVGHGTAQSPLVVVGARSPKSGPGTLTAGTNLPAGAALRAAAGGLAELAIADGTANGNVIGVSGTTTIASELSEWAIGLVVLIASAWDAVTGGSGGLTPGTTYYLSQATPGHLTTVKPGSGQVVVIGTALSPTAMQVVPQQASVAASAAVAFPVQTFVHSFNVVLDKTNVLTTPDDLPIATLPSAAAAGNGGIAIVKLLGTPSVTITPGAGDTIDNLATLVLSHDLDFAWLVSDGVHNWIVAAAGQVLT